MGIFLVIFISNKHCLYSLHIVVFWRGSADLFKERNCSEDFSTNTSTTNIPAIHTHNKMLLIIVGVLEFTEIVNSFIQSEELERVAGETTVLFWSVWNAGDIITWLSQETVYFVLEKMVLKAEQVKNTINYTASGLSECF